MKSGLLKKIGDFIVRNMALLVLVAAVCAFFWPSATGVVRVSWVTPLLGCVMFGMGLTMEFGEFRSVFSHPKELLMGFVCQITVMPGLAVVLSRVFGLTPELALGVVLVGCCPGGTSSNVITFLSHGDVPLSVGMTCVSTLLAPVMTPLLVKICIGAVVPVDFWGMFLSIAEVIIAPICIGLLFKRFLPSAARSVASILPAFSTLAITMIVVAVVSANAARLHECGLVVACVVILHNILGYALGFGVAKLFRLPSKKTTAVSVEVGMQNSGLACSLASSQFQALAMASVPGAVFSVWHNISGALVARLFSRLNDVVDLSHS